MYDLHAHILPGVDDGAETMEDAVEMARVAAEHGTKMILATPHRKDVTETSSVSHIRDLLANLTSELDNRSVKLELRLGMENHVDLDLPEDFSRGLALPMNGSRYVLVELPFFGYHNHVEDILFQLCSQGMIPVLAHPERIEAIQKSPDLLDMFVGHGMLSQITAGSIVGYFGEKVKRLSHNILRMGLAHIIASDTHLPEGYRSPRLLQGVEAAARIVGPEKAEAMVVDMPRAILSDLLIDV